jgi:transposase
MYIAKIPNRNSPPAILLRESYRDNGKVKSRTLANLSNLPPHSIEILRRSLKGENLISTDAFEIIENGSPAHGHIDAVMTAMSRLDFSRLICSRRSRERDLIVAMVVARILEPKSKLATTLWWADTTLPGILNVSDADEDELYDAMDWLLAHQGSIENKLANRHLQNDALALYDLTSSYFEGQTCPLAALGHNRDGKKGKLQVNYGLLTNRNGIPVAVSIFKGNTGDPKTLMPQVEKMRDEFNIERFVMVGDRGMLTQKQIDELHDIDGIDWIGALRPEAIKKLITNGGIQMGLFDERNLFELKHPDFPDERLIACRNVDLAYRRSVKRESLLQATVKELDKVRGMVLRGRLRGKKEIEARVSAILKGYKIGKYYKVDIREDGFSYKVNEDKLIAEITAKSRGDQNLIEKRLKRSQLHIESISKQLGKLNRKLSRGRLYGQDKIGVRVGKVVNKYKVGKHFDLDISDNDFSFEINREKVKKEAALDGIYIVRTSLPQKRMDADETVRSYKLLSQVERAFRSFKTVDLMVRPIRHRLEDRVRAHIFLCMLAYYVQWHMMEAWRPLLYADEDQKAKSQRDPVASAIRSDSALKKVKTKQLDDGSRVYSFRSLLSHLAAIVSATCRCSGEKGTSATFTMITSPNPKQQKAFDLLQTIRV